MFDTTDRTSHIGKITLLIYVKYSTLTRFLRALYSALPGHAWDNGRVVTTDTAAAL